MADAAALGAEELPGAVAEIAAAGVRWIQMRAKGLPDRDLFRLVEACHQRVADLDCQLWMNDRADLAALFPFAGVHLGQDDLPPGAVRRVVGGAVWIGRSTHDPAQLGAADADPEVDVVAYGPVFATSSKAEPDPTVGLDALRAARSLTTKPLVAIGGIDAGNLAAVLDTGVDSAAMIAAICHGDIGANCRRLLQAAAGGQENE